MTRNDPMAIDECFAPFEAHKKSCRHCGPWSNCSIALRLLKEAAKEAERRLGNVMEPKVKA